MGKYELNSLWNEKYGSLKLTIKGINGNKVRMDNGIVITKQFLSRNYKLKSK